MTAAEKGRCIAEADRIIRGVLDKGTPRGLSDSESASLLYVLRLLELDKQNMVLTAQFPIGTTVYQASYGGCRKETITVNGYEYSRDVPYWYVTHHEYSWADAMCDAENPERRKARHKEYYLSPEEAKATVAVLNQDGVKGA